jgi:hypothetical protein
MTFLENEVKLDSLEQSVLLTNYRILKGNRNLYNTSIFLDKITSITMRYSRKPLLLYLGGISIFIGMISHYYVKTSYYNYDEAPQSSPFMIFLIIGIVFTISYFLTKKPIITIYPDDGKKIDIEVKKTSKECIEKFVTNIQEAKLETNKKYTIQ